MNKKLSYEDLEKKIQKLEQAESDRKKARKALKESERNLQREQHISKTDSRYYHQDITERVEMENKLEQSNAELSVLSKREAQVNTILKKLALGGDRLEEILALILEAAEEESSGTIASILLVNKDKKQLFCDVKSHLPEYFVKAINGTPIRDEMGSCGTAAFRGETIIAENLQTHPYWEGVRELTKKAGLNACWSQPVISSKGTVVGTFALYYSKPKRPSIIELELMKSMAQLAAISIESHRIKKEKIVLGKMLANIIDSMPSVLIGVDPDLRITQWNRQANKITGIFPEDALGRPLDQVFPRMAPGMEQVKKAIQTRHVSSNHRQARHENGNTFYDDVTIYPLVANGVEGAVIRVDDVTEQVRLEEIMVQSEKMHSVGGLAAGMAHEINNPLAGIMQTADVMSKRLTDINMPANLRSAEEIGIAIDDIKTFMEKRDIMRMLSAINESGRRMASIVDNMLSFARKSDAQVSSNSLSELFDKTLELASTDYDLKKHYDFKMIKVKKEYDNNVPQVPCESAKIQQVLLNILRNGAQAMQEAVIEKPMFVVRTKFEKNQKMVCLEIEDNGPGMEEATRKRIFEPFYTTKPVGIGTGLGLSVSYFIITQNHGGKISAEHTPGSGAKFIIRLPLKGKGV